MHGKRRKPSPPLDVYIDGLYYLDSPVLYPDLKLLLMPSPHWMVNLGDAFYVHQPGQREAAVTCAESWWWGLSRSYQLIDCPPHIRLFGVQFKPEGAYPFLGLPLAELHDQAVPLDALWGRSCAVAIREQLCAAPNVQAGFALLESWLLVRLGETPQHLDTVRYAISEIAQERGLLSIRGLSETIGISHNHLSSLFRRLVGVSPKALARFHRFAYALHLADHAPAINWTHIAHEAGFYDQAHFNRDFSALIGYTPSGYLHERCLLHIETPEYAT
jgi:AraC-like DNA-binding protein